MKGRHAEVAGAGIAGLALATSLAKQGWTVCVHERSETIREIGAGIFIKGNGLSVLDQLNLGQTLRDMGVRLQTAEVWDHRGRMLQQRQLRGASTVYNLPRRALIDVLLAAATQAGVVIQTSSRVVGAAPEGLLRTSDGVEHRGDLVVLADGHRSSARDALGLLHRRRTLKTGATRLLVSRTTSDLEGTQEWWSRDRRVGIAACSPERTYVYLSSPNADRAGAAVPINVADWGRAFPKLADFLVRLGNVEATRNAYGYVRCHQWHVGRVAVVGDAAHALPPTLGQGAGLSLMNGHRLVEVLSERRDVPSGLAEWERLARPVTEQTQVWSLRYDRLTSAWPPALADVRSAAIWALGRVPGMNARMRIADRQIAGTLR